MWEFEKGSENRISSGHGKLGDARESAVSVVGPESYNQEFQQGGRDGRDKSDK